MRLEGTETFFLLQNVLVGCERMRKQRLLRRSVQAVLTML